MSVEVVCPQHSGLAQKVDNLDKSMTEYKVTHQDEHKEMWKVLDSLRNRLPTWAVFLISGLTGVIGWLVH